MYKQDLNIGDHPLESFGRIIYYFFGFVFLALANLFTVFSYVYLLAFNIYLKWENKITYKFMNFFDQIYRNKSAVTVTILCFSVLSFIMSSGALASLFQYISEKSSNNFNELMNSMQQ